MSQDRDRGHSFSSQSAVSRDDNGAAGAIRFTAAVPDEEYWRRQIKCQYACPVHTDARGYVRAIAAGDYEAAYLIARGPNPLASICGRVCGAPCEAACRRGSIDQPIAIRALKRFVADQYRRSSSRAPASSPKGACDGLEEMANLARFLASREYRQPEGMRVAIIGSGPAGLAAAHDLALMGMAPTIFEAEPRPAGMLYTGIPAYRLPRDLIDAEIELIRVAGRRVPLRREDRPRRRLRRSSAATSRP